MPAPVLNSKSQSVDTLYLPDGTPVIKAAIGTVATVDGVSIAHQAVASHLQGDDLSAGTFPVSVMAAIDPTNSARTPLVDATGRLLVDAQSRRARVSPSAQPVVSTTAYAAKDAIGGILTFGTVTRPVILSSVIEKVILIDRAQQMAAIDLVLFRVAPAATTDNAIFAPTDTELGDCVGIIKIATTDYSDFSTNSVAVVLPSRPIVLPTTSLYVVLVSRGTPTYVATTDLAISIVVKTD